VTGPDGEPLAGASVDVWQTNEDGFYDVQQPDTQPMEDQLYGGTGRDRAGAAERAAPWV
jgi:protocatechuate 3,4-dioxygenase beta subunit